MDACCTDPATARAAADPAGVNSGLAMANLTVHTNVPKIMAPIPGDGDADDAAGWARTDPGPSPLRRP